MRRRYSTLSLLILLVLFGCQREISFIGGVDTPRGEIATPDPVTAALQGNVFDETGAPAADVTVQAGSKTTLSDKNGYFRINDASLDKKTAVITATKAGYFKGYRTFAATSGANYVNIKLAKKTAAGTIDAATGGDVSISNGSRVALSASAVVKATSGVAYNGQVKVYAAYIDPTASDIDQIIPGSFMANDKDGKRVTLSSYGMLAVELESASGEKLQIKSGSTAKLTTAIPSSLQASAPAAIALWSVDETTGVWKEEGIATKSGNAYLGEVKHFSFWNCDVSATAVTLSMTLKNSDGNPLIGAHVTLKRPNTNWVVHGYTDSLGQVSGYVPNNEALVMNVLNQCGNSFYNQNIGPFAQPTNLGTITLTNSGSSVVTVKGKLVDCSGIAITNGYALVAFGYATHYSAVNTTGDFQTTFVRCANGPTSFTVVGIDNATQQAGGSTAVTLTTPLTNAGSVSACGTSILQFINYTLDGTTYSVTSSTPGYMFSGYSDSLQPGIIGSTSVKVYSTSNSFDRLIFGFRHQNLAPGTYQLTGLMAQSYNTGGGAVGVTLLSPSNVVLTTFPQSVGQFYEGSISSTFKDSLNTTHSLTGTFKIMRQ